ncbi:MAG: FAD-dependent oxidoreductase, partial [Armatimonadota bacterium]
MSTYLLNASQRFATEVLVLGDGLAAFSAALEAASRGKRTLVAASGPALAAELTVALHGVVGHITDPHLSELRDRVAEVGGEHDGWLDPAIAQMVADQMLAEAEVEVLLYAVPIRAILRDCRTLGALMAGKDGLYTIAAGAVIDATQDGVLLRQEGAEFAAPRTVSAARTLYFSSAGDDLSGLPAEVEGFKLSARVTIPGEVCVTITGEAEYDGAPVPAALHRATRLAERAVASACLASVPGLRNAFVTHSGHQLLPLKGPNLASPGAPCGNLTGAGAWVGGIDWSDLAGLSAYGFDAAVVACDHLETTSEPVALTETLELPAEPLPVGVFGGGTGGPLAAWAAARLGARTALFEAGWSLGGIATCGGIHWYYHGVPGGLQQLMHDEAEAVTADLGAAGRTHGFHPEARKIALESLLLRDGVSVRYGWTAVAVQRDGDRLSSVLLATPGRLHLVQPTVAIDATGDADVLAKAGAAIVYGREADGLSHQYSQSAACLRDGHLGHFNFDAGYVDARDTADLTRARRHALQLYWNPSSFVSPERPFNVAYLLGLRQSRHILGDYTLTLDDQVTNRHFADVVAYGQCHQDNHAFDYENENDDAMLWCWGLGFWKKMMQHELPYRCLTPQGLCNALVACRAVSVSREAHMLFRMIRDMYRIGEAAGAAAALALPHGGDVRALDVAQLQGKLRETGALLADWPAPEAVGTPEALVAQLVDELPQVAVWHLYPHG